MPDPLKAAIGGVLAVVAFLSVITILQQTVGG